MTTVCCTDIQGLRPEEARRSGRSGGAGSAFAWSLLDYILETEYGLGSLRVAQDGHGKPYFPALPGLCFSLSHTRTHVLCAVSDVPVGCDIETRRELRTPFQDRITTPEERRDFDFFDLWVLRESFYKLMGEGDLRRLRFSRSGDEILAPHPEVRPRLYAEAEGCAAAVCLRGGKPPAAMRVVRPEMLLKKCT